MIAAVYAAGKKEAGAIYGTVTLPSKWNNACAQTAQIFSIERNKAML